MDKKYILQRIGKDFNKQLEEIIETRLEKGKDKRKTSIRKLTNLLIHHNFWIDIKDDMIEFDFNKVKRGVKIEQ